MVKRRPHRAKEGFRDDPMIPIDCEVLRAVVDDQGLTIAALARRTNDSEQTLAHLYKGAGIRRCRQSRRGKLAQVLRIAEELLAGDPVFTPHLPGLPRGYEMLYSRKTELAASRLLTKVANACMRDLEDPVLSPADYPKLAPKQIVVQYVTGYASEFLQINEWRRHLIQWDPEEHERRGYTEPATENPWISSQRPANDPEHEQAVLAFARAVEHVLEPWFRGEAHLNYRALRDIAHLPAHPFADADEAIPETSPYAVLLPSTLTGTDTSSKNRAKRTRKRSSSSARSPRSKGRKRR